MSEHNERYVIRVSETVHQNAWIFGPYLSQDEARIEAHRFRMNHKGLKAQALPVRPPSQMTKDFKDYKKFPESEEGSAF